MNADLEKRIERLSNICARLGSTFGGERAAAALLATRALDGLGLDWREFVRRAFAGELARAFRPHEAEREPESQVTNYIEQCLALLDWDGLSVWERGFVESLRDRWPCGLTQKQATVLDRIIWRFNQQQPS